MNLYVMVNNVCESSGNMVSNSYLEITHTGKDVSKRWNVVCFTGQICANKDTDSPIFNQMNSVKWMLENDAKHMIGCGCGTATFVTAILKYMEGFVCCPPSTII